MEDETPPVTAAALLEYLERMRAEGKPLNEITVRIEVSDSFYDNNLRPWGISEAEYTDANGGKLRPYLILFGS